jgi:hypothetical protein
MRHSQRRSTRYLAPVCRGSPAAAGRPYRTMVRRMQPTQARWEYATVPLLVHATKQILDNWGEDGWELVTVVPGPSADQLVAYLKRPKATP